MQYQKNKLFLNYLFIFTFLVITPFSNLYSSLIQIDSINTNIENNEKENYLNKDKEILFNQFEFGLNNKISNFRQFLNFDSFESTNRQNVKLKNYNSTILIPEIYAKYNFNDYFGLSLGLSYLNFNYEDNLLESFPVSQNGDPIIASINTKTLAKISSLALNQNLYFKYYDFTLNAGLGVFFCLHLT